jgi:citrate lyase beta subunit
VPWRSEAFKKIYIFCQASVVSVPIVAKVDNTLVSRLRWGANNYVGRLDTKTTSLRSACLKYLGLAIPRYVYGSTNLVGRHGCVTF